MIKTYIETDNVMDYFNTHKDELNDGMTIIATTDTDEDAKKSYLFLTSMEGQAFVSLEAPNIIVDSSYISEFTAKPTILCFLEALETL